jgi:hypothetical protein
MKNIDIANKFNLIENKLDVLNTTLNLKKYILKDFLNYIEFKKYIQHTFYELKNEILSQIETTETINKVNNIFVEYIDYIFVIIDEKVKTFYNEKDLDVNVYTYESVKNMEDKINNLYFENEVIKHQLQLGERIYKLEDTLNNLQTDIKMKMDEIDEIIKN